MDVRSNNTGNFKRIALGTISAIGICTLTFSIATTSAQSAVVNKTYSIPTVYQASSASAKPNAPKGYVKANYKVKLTESASKSTSKDMPAKDAAELGAQDIWRLFGANLNNKTIEMSYNEVTSTHIRAEWQGEIKIEKNLLYWFTVDAITGEYCTTSQNKYWTGNINVGFDKTLDKNSEQYQELAKKTAEKYKFVSGKVVSVEYDGQGYIGNNDGTAKNPEISLMVTSDNGRKAQLTFSKYNQELLQVSYDSSVKDMEVYAKIAEEEHLKRRQQIEDEKSDNKMMQIPLQN